MNKFEIKNYMMKLFSKNYIIIISFVFLSILSSIIMLRSHNVISSWDLNFHWSRIFDMQQSLLHGRFFDDVSLSGFNQSGSAAMSLYPKINLIPIVVIGFFVKSFVRLIYIIFILRNFLGLLVSFYSCFLFTKDKSISYIFSISYTLSTVTLFYSFRSMDMGVSTSLIYIPMVIFGSLELIENNRWKELTIGMSAIVGSHVITSGLAIIFISLILTINYKKFKDSIFLKSFIKFFIVTILLTSIVWIPLVVISINNHISMPVVLNPLVGVSFSTFVYMASNNVVSQYLTIFAVLGILFSIFKYKELHRYEKQLFWVSLFLIFVSSSFFPWDFLNGTFLKQSFQFPYRFLLLSQPILCYLFAKSTFLITKAKKMKSIVIVIMVSFLVVTSQIVGQKEVVNMDVPYDFNNINNNGLLYSDYWPKEITSRPYLYEMIKSHYGLGNNRKVMFYLDGNGLFSFKTSASNSNVKVPFMIYRSVSYDVKIDGQNVKYSTDKNELMNISNVKKGSHKLLISVNRSWYDLISYVLTISGIFVLLVLDKKRFFSAFRCVKTKIRRIINEN